MTHPHMAALSSLATKARRREYKLRVRMVKASEKAQTAELIKTAMQSPVLAGTGAFLAVHLIESALKVKVGAPVGNTADQRAASQGIDWLGIFEKALIGAFLPGSAGAVAGALGQVTGSASGGNLFDIFKNLDFAALKAVILIYIASGGNLAGLLQQSSGVLGDILKSTGASSLAGAVAP